MFFLLWVCTVYRLGAKIPLLNTESNLSFITSLRKGCFDNGTGSKSGTMSCLYVYLSLANFGPFLILPVYNSFQAAPHLKVAARKQMMKPTVEQYPI